MISHLRGEDIGGNPLWEARLVNMFGDPKSVTWMSTGLGKLGFITHSWGDDHQTKGLQSVIAFWLAEASDTAMISTNTGARVDPNRVVPDERARLIVAQIQRDSPYDPATDPGRL